MRFAADFPPAPGPSAATRRRPFGPHEAEASVPDPARLAAALAGAEQAAAALRAQPLAPVLASLARIAELWADADAEPAATACTVLAAGTGYSGPVLRRGLGALVDALRGDAVGALLDRELGDRNSLDAGSWRVPRRITHVLSGNIPGLGFAPIALSLALRSAVLVKCAAGDPYSPAAFARSVAAIDPALARCLVVCDWRGGDVDVEEVAFAADVVVASGSDAAIAAIARRVRGRFFGHGHKVSFAFVARELPGGIGALAARLAFDVALWDQQGCLSPQLCLVEAGGAADAAAFAAALAAALDRIAVELPPRRLDLDERAAVAAFRDEAEWQPGTARDRLFAAADGRWAVSLEYMPRFRPTCLNRCIRVVAIDDAGALPALLAPHRAHLECAGLAAAPPREAELAALLGAAGVHRVCALGTMQTPDLGWRQGGGPRVRDWLEPAGDEG